MFYSLCRNTESLTNTELLSTNLNPFLVFKVFTIEEEEFVENVNLRVGKNLNLNFSCNDVAWSPQDGKF